MNDNAHNNDDYIWGVPAIAAELNTTRPKVYDLLRRGVLADATKKLGHRTIVASRTALRRIMPGLHTNPEK